MALRPQDPDPAKDKSAQRKAAEQDVFAREVDEALRQDEMQGFFKRYGLPVLVLVVTGLAGLGGYLWWESSQRQAAGERGEQLVLALDDLQANNLQGADKKLVPIAEEGRGGSAAAAKLLRAGIALEQNRTKEAIKLYAEVAGDSEVPQPYRDLALVREVAAGFDDMPPERVIERLKPLAVPGNAWFGVAGELVGMAYLKQGRTELAGPLFASIARDEDLPESLRGRTRQLAGLLGVDALDDVVGDRESRSREASPATSAER